MQLFSWQTLAESALKLACDSMQAAISEVCL